MLIIFDLGETLIFYEGLGLNWKDHYQAALEKAAHSVGCKIKPDEMKCCRDILIYYNTRENPRIVEVQESEVLRKITEAIGQDLDRLQFEIEFFKYFQRKVKPEATALNTLKYLRKKDCKSVVLSDAAYVMPKSLMMEDLGDLRDYIDAVYSSTDIGIETIVDEFKLNKDSIIFVGNEEKDIETANNFGVRSLLLSSSHAIKNFGQTATIRALNEIERYIV
jgi:FMN phosphatase YigB (HAD superfamily)